MDVDNTLTSSKAAGTESPPQIFNYAFRSHSSIELSKSYASSHFIVCERFTDNAISFNVSRHIESGLRIMPAPRPLRAACNTAPARGWPRRASCTRPIPGSTPPPSPAAAPPQSRCRLRGCAPLRSKHRQDRPPRLPALHPGRAPATRERLCVSKGQPLLTVSHHLRENRDACGAALNTSERQRAIVSRLSGYVVGAIRDKNSCILEECKTHFAMRSIARQKPTAPTGAGTQFGRASHRLRISESYRPPDATASNPVGHNDIGHACVVLTPLQCAHSEVTHLGRVALSL